MSRSIGGVVLLAYGLTGPASEVDGQERPPSPAAQYKALAQEFFDATQVFSFKAKTDAERKNAVTRIDRVRRKLLELAEKNPKDPSALDALVAVVKQEIWLENNTSHPGTGKVSPGTRAIAQLLRDHLQSRKLAAACQRAGYGFRPEYESFLRAVLAKNPHRDVQAVACLRLAQFLNARMQKLELLKEQPALRQRYRALFGNDYMAALQRLDRVKAAREVESLFERAARQYGDVKIRFRGTVGEGAAAELYEIRHLSVGKKALEIEGMDQHGKRFKLSDYRGKVVLLYFWQQICPT